MEISIGIVSRNLVTHANFVEFRNSRIFHEFREDGRRVDLENWIFRKIPKNVKYLNNVHLRLLKLEPKQNKLFRSLNRPRGTRGHMGPTL